MNNLRHFPVTSSSARGGSTSYCLSTADGLPREEDVGAALSPITEGPEDITTGKDAYDGNNPRYSVNRTPRASADLPTRIAAPQNEGQGGTEATTKAKRAGKPVEGTGDLQTVDRLLEEALHDQMAEVGPNQEAGEGDPYDIGEVPFMCVRV